MGGVFVIQILYCIFARKKGKNMAKASGSTRTKGSGGGFDSQISSWEKKMNRDIERIMSSNSGDYYKADREVSHHIEREVYNMQDRADIYYTNKKRAARDRGDGDAYDAASDRFNQAYQRIEKISNRLQTKRSELIGQLRAKKNGW